MKLNLCHLILFISILSLEFSCTKPCEKGSDNYTYLSEKDKATLIYQGNESLKFLRNGKDTIILKSNFRERFVSIRNTTNGDCPGPNVVSEGFEVNFYDTAKNIKLFTNIIEDNGSTLYIKYVDSNVSSSFFSYPFGIRVAKDTITILNNFYEHVDRFYSTYNNQTLLYDRIYGVILIETQNDTLKLMR